MAIHPNTIRIKRSATTATPPLLKEGELAYSEMSGNLFIGTAGGTNIQIIGGLTAITKLAGIEVGATADQTPAEILAALLTVDGSGTLLDADTVDGHQAVDFALQTDLANYVQAALLGVANGVATLDAGGLIPTSQIPALAITTPNVVGSEPAMLALSVQIGDIAIRTDIGKSYMLAASPASSLANWKEISAGGAVTSVNGQIGVIVLTAADVGADPAGAAAAVQIAVQANIDAHVTATNDPHGTLALLSSYLQANDELDGGGF